MHELDQTLQRRAYDRIAPSYDETDFFNAEIRVRLSERLDLITLEPAVLLNLGSGTGAGSRELQALYPQALVIDLDWSEAMLAAATHEAAGICADSHKLPLADASVDLILSNMMLPDCADPMAVFSEARRVLRNPGLFMFSTLGPDTLREVRTAWSQVDDHPHVHVFADMHNVGDALVHAGFREPVMDVAALTINYQNTRRLTEDLRAVAATNIDANRRRGLTTPRRWQSFVHELDGRRNTAGKIPVTMEVIIGQAWTGAPERGVPLTDGEASFPLSRLQR
jgi:malonyl-CoA O-methyltransferase